MYRFYCKVCKKVKRVQKRPVLLENGDHGNPTMRIGACNKHIESRKPFSLAERFQSQSRIHRTGTR